MGYRSAHYAGGGGDPHALEPKNVVEAQIRCLPAHGGGEVRPERRDGAGRGDRRAAGVRAGAEGSKAQLHLLQKLMVAISDEEMLAALLDAKTPSDFSNIFNGGTSAG